MVHLLGSNIDNLMNKSSRTVSGLYLMSMSEKRFCEKRLDNKLSISQQYTLAVKKANSVRKTWSYWNEPNVGPQR